MLHRALKQIRLFHQLKQVELAKELDISKSYLSAIESDNIEKKISLELLEKYSKYFSIPVSSLLLFSESMNGKDSESLKHKSLKKVLAIMEWANARNELKK